MRFVSRIQASAGPLRRRAARWMRHSPGPELTAAEGLASNLFDLDGFGAYSLEEFARTFYAAERVNFVAPA